MKILLGISGHKTAGKDTVAEMLVPHFKSTFKVHRIGFADGLKEELARITGGNVGTINKHKHEPLCRKVLQFIGQEAKTLEKNDKIWVDKTNELYRKLPDMSLVIVPDVRFPFEAEWVKENKGLVIRIFRPQADSVVDSHLSESLVDTIPFDFSISNDGKLEDLKRNVYWLSGHIKEYYKI